MNVRRSQGPLVYKSPFLSEPKRKPVTSGLHRNNTSPRAGHLVKVPPTRPTRKICQERFACKKPLRVAAFECTDCRTIQCDACETLIHENPKFLFHDRKKLQFPSNDLICELNCETKNLADVFCKPCNKRLCFACDLIAHQYKSSHPHYRVPFELDEFFSLQPTLEPEPYYTEESSLWNDDEEFHSVIPQHVSVGCHTKNTDESLQFMQELPRSDSNSKSDFYSLSDPDSMMSMKSLLPDVTEDAQKSFSKNMKNYDSNDKSFLLINDGETIQVGTEEEFIELLGCQSNSLVKVISIFGNTGEGKSHTLNHTFFGGAEVFTTSDSQISCTVGVWAAYNKGLNVIILDTEGLLGLTSNQNQRTRLLLKVLAVSDLIIYRTKADRLHTDLFNFLGDASKAYMSHFATELQAASKRFNFEGSLSQLGPSVIIFHETTHTNVLSMDQGKTAEEQVKQRFRDQEKTIDAFSAIDYVGVKTVKQPTSFTSLTIAIKKSLENITIRSARTPGVIYQLLKALNTKFSGAIENSIPSTFPDQYFTCNTVCQSCNSPCTHSMNHISEGIGHMSPGMCRFQHQFDNKIFLCLQCHKNGTIVQVIPKTSSSTESSWLGLVKYAWSGYVIECSNCGIIYRSREYWYGNKDPWEASVRTETTHVWPGEVGSSLTNQNAAQRVIDSVQYISGAVSSISAKPTKSITSWVADQFAPTYWVPNYLIVNCTKCETPFGPMDQKHHCRACGKGFCDDCSSQTRPVPEKGWGTEPVRVCDDCFAEEQIPVNPGDTVTARKVGEVLQSAIGTVASGINYPLVMIKDTARPAYWIPDESITNCCMCKMAFSIKLSLHHCRACGKGVCEGCSKSLKPVPSRGWDYPVRICDACFKKDDL